MFNELTDTYAYVGNWDGVTVEKKLGRIKHSEIVVVDLPGIYSLNPLTKDEAVAVNYLLNDLPDLILNVTNASQLKRNLLLSLEVLEFGQPVVLALNMIDDLTRSGIRYDLDVLADRLGCQVRATNARKKTGLAQLKTELLAEQRQPAAPLVLPYPRPVSDAVQIATGALVADFDLAPQFARWLAIQYMNKNQTVRRYVADRGLTPLTENQTSYDRQHFDDQIFNTRLTFIERTLTEATQYLNTSHDANLTAKLDRWITHPILGLPVFVGIFYLMFKLSFDWVGTPLSDALDALLSGPVSTTVANLLTSIGTLPFLKSLIVNGIIAGVGGVLTFMPQIFVLFVTALFPHSQAVIVLSLYFLGIVIALLMAKLYQWLFHIRESSVFIVELPKYHLPRLDIIAMGTWDKGKGFVKKAGTIIFAGTVLIWLLSNLGPSGIVTNINQSFAAMVGQVMLPVFKPMGITAWQPISALLTGVLAKEVISSSMIVMFHLAGQTSLVATFGGLFTPLSAYCILVFILIYAPCFATLAAIKSETGSLKWAAYALVSNTLIAYVIAVGIYQLGALFI